MRCAVIGCGRIGCGFDDNSKIIRTHAGSYYTNPKTQLVSLCDVDTSKLEKYGRKYGITSLYTDSEQMFKKENLDCVSICTLVDTHLDLVTQAAKNHVKAIFLEKPISSSIPESKKIIQICKKYNVKLAVDHQRRFNPFYRSLGNFLKQKKLGDIQLVNVYYGSGVANTGSHLFDVLRLFFGDPLSITSTSIQNNSINRSDPNINATIKFQNGLICNLQTVDYSKYAVLEMDIFGTLGRIQFNMISDKITYFKKQKGLVYNTLIPANLKFKLPTKSPIQLAVANLVSSIGSKNEPMCTGYDGYKSLELIIAATISSKSRKEIKLPLKNNYKITSK